MNEPAEDTDLISQKAEIFRSKLISDFHLLESLSEGGRRVETPALYTHDITDPVKSNKIMLNRPHALVRFHIYQKPKGVTCDLERRRNRIKNKNTKNPPIDLWANWVVSSALFQNLILTLILVNSVVLGIQAEISDRKLNSDLELLSLILDIFDYCALLFFVVEIILKWLDNFSLFWRNRWNIFDFCVTFLSFVPEIMKYSQPDSQEGATSDLAVVAENLRTFRVLRSLKMVSRFQKVRLIVLAVTKAFQAMVFITLLLFIFAYIFAIIGVIFLDYSQHVEHLTYENSFSSILEALVTLFQLFTLDHWLDVYKDVRIVAGQGFAALYVIVWIVIGSFIIRNIFVGIMVNNFQGIRNDLFEEVGDIQEKEKRDVEMFEFAAELDRQTKKRMSMVSGRGDGLDAQEGEDENTDSGFKLKSDSRFKSAEELIEAIDQNVNKADMESEEWANVVEKNLENLAKEEASFCWPRDSLFKYFLMLETLQENLKERQEILTLTSEMISQFHDT